VVSVLEKIGFGKQIIFMEFEEEGGGQIYEEFFLLPFVAVDIYVLCVYKSTHCSVTNVTIKSYTICDKCCINLFRNIYII